MRYRELLKKEQDHWADFYRDLPGTKDEGHYTCRSWTDQDGRTVYGVFLGSRKVATAKLSSDQQYVSDLEVAKELRGRKIATALYRRIEQDLGRALKPSPLHQTPDGAGFWKSRLKEKADRKNALPAAFWTWFGQSKVVDHDGNPLVLFHGTNADIHSFRGMVWASVTPDLASQYASFRDNMGGNIMPLYMKIERPFNADLGLSKTVSIGSFFHAVIEQAQDNGVELTEERTTRARELMEIINTARRREGSGPHYDRHNFWNDVRAPFGRDGEDAIRQMFALFGFDGIMMREGGELTYGAFSPTQVKSAFNRGTFNPDDANISEDMFEAAAPKRVKIVTAKGKEFEVEMEYTKETAVSFSAYCGDEYAGHVDFSFERDPNDLSHITGEPKKMAWMATGLFVNQEFRRYGLATALYNYAHKKGIRPIIPSNNIKPDGQEFWNKHLRPTFKIGQKPKYPKRQWDPKRTK